MSFYKTKTIAITESGITTYQAVKDALQLSLERKEPIEFEFNATKIIVDSSEIIANIVIEQYDRKRNS